jgi:hypothetical protein
VASRCRRRQATIGGIASSSKTSTAASTTSTPPMLLLSDAARLPGESVRLPLPPVVTPGRLTALLLVPGDGVPAPGLVELPDAGLVELLPEPPELGVEVGAGGLPFFGLPVTPTPVSPTHGPWPDLSQDGGSGAMWARKFELSE